MEYQDFYKQAIPEAREVVKSLRQVPIGVYDDNNPYIFIEEDSNGSLEINPDSLEAMSPTQVSLEMFKLSSMTTTINRRYTEYKTALDTMEKELENYKEHCMKEGSGKVTTKRAEVKTSEYYLQLNYEITKLSNICNLLKTAIDNYDRVYTSLSRHLTALQNDMDKDNRNERKPNNANYMQSSLKGTPSRGKRITS